MSDLVERLRSVIAGDYDTHGTLSMGGRTICDVPLIRDASDMAEMCHDAAAEIERLRAAHAENARLLGLLAHDLQGRIEGGKLAAISQCADRAALSAAPEPGR